MTPTTQRQADRLGLLIATLMLGVSSGCSSGTAYDNPSRDYTQRIMSVSPTAGNAQAANTVIQTAGPWPAYGYDTSVPGDGERMVKAYRSYENRDGSGGGAPPPSAVGPLGPGGAPPPPS